jgi:hypothetical protein
MIWKDVRRFQAAFAARSPAGAHASASGGRPCVRRSLAAADLPGGALTFQRVRDADRLPAVVGLGDEAVAHAVAAAEWFRVVAQDHGGRSRPSRGVAGRRRAWARS